MELSKRERQIAKKLIDKSVIVEFAIGLKNFNEITNNWQTNNLDNRASYQEIFSAVKKFDKHIAQRYDCLTGSNYIFVLIDLLREKIIKIEDFSEMNAETISKIKSIVS